MIRPIVGGVAGSAAIYFAAVANPAAAAVAVIITAAVFQPTIPTCRNLARELARLEKRPVVITRKGINRFELRIYGIEWGPYTGAELRRVLIKLIRKARRMYGESV